MHLLRQDHRRRVAFACLGLIREEMLEPMLEARIQWQDAFDALGSIIADLRKNACAES
jgi:hypothetical protein